ncbi:MAG: winged helix-turn-helix transcriptional regulator [Mycobacterium sp.]|uniref:winged helix-turn-helix domain-containing protein n=1 Tax=Mycobacterium sp. TaxID=1785 RepID=UPI001ECE0197|nr:winged helix-turn-helix domain-containing protein [Mycobacterium sp.]MBW0019215.1 winged helix-turn-helix transcriptional regulator [Mycobacterium sp.]
MDALLLTDEADFEAVLPTLRSFAESVRRESLADDQDRPDGHLQSVDVAIIDARSDLTAARRACRQLAATAPAIAVVAVVAPEDFVAVDVDWNFDDVLLAAACAAELQTRLRLAIARRRNAQEGSLQFGDLVLHPASYGATLAGSDLNLTLTEFKLLNFLVQHAGRAFTRTRLMHEVWGYDSSGQVRTVDVHVRRLRGKLGSGHESIVETVRGVGYMAVTPPQPRWIAGDPVLSPAWASAPAPDSVAQ